MLLDSERRLNAVKIKIKVKAQTFYCPSKCGIILFPRSLIASSLKIISYITKLGYYLLAQQRSANTAKMSKAHTYTHTCKNEQPLGYTSRYPDQVSHIVSIEYPRFLRLARAEQRQ